MRQRFFLLLAALCLPAPVLGAVSAGCGSTIVEDDPDASSGGGGGSSHSDGQVPTGPGSGGKDGGKDALPDYTDPGCPDAGPPVSSFECDPYDQANSGCAFGEGCYIYVQYPDEPCGQEVYGSVCLPSGPGQQGDSCNGAQDCGAGFVCVVSGSGTQCVQLCPLKGPDGCPPGLVCEPIDVEGFGGCL